MKRKALILLCVGLLALLAVLLCVAVSFTADKAQQPDQTQLPETSTSAQTSEPTQTESSAAPVTLPPKQTMQDKICALLENEALALDADEAFLTWLAGYFGEPVLDSVLRCLENGYDRSLWYTVCGNSYHVLCDVYTGALEQDNIHLISLGKPNGESADTTLLFGGDICFADNYLPMQYLSSIGGTLSDGIDQRLIDALNSADISFMNNEFAISDRGSAMPGKLYTFRAATANTAMYNELGIDIVSLANNHAYDYGEDAFADTMSALNEYGVAYVGGGSNLEEAMKPQYYIVNGRKIAYVAATRAEKNIMTPEAQENTSGVLRCYDPERLISVIEQSAAESDYVVACIHWGTEYSDVLENAQTETAKQYIDAGADVIIGAHAHQLQGIELYNGKAIYYNLGNFWFNDYTIETGLACVQIDSSGALTYSFLPALQKDCFTSWEVGTQTGAQILENLEEISINVQIDENGVITEK